MSDIFACAKCNSDFLKDAKKCCPKVEGKIINIQNINLHNNFDLQKDFVNRKNGFIKYEPLNDSGLPNYSTVVQYDYIMKYCSNMFKSPVVLDFGCALAHAAHIVKNTDGATYIGAEIKEDVVFAADKLYNKHDYLYVLQQVEQSKGKKLKVSSSAYKPYNVLKPKCLENIKSESVDIIILSRTQHWVKFENYFDEFRRVMKPNSILYIFSNPKSDCDKNKSSIFNYLVKYFEPLESKRFDPLHSKQQNISNSVYGDINAYTISKYNNEDAVIGIFKKVS